MIEKLGEAMKSQPPGDDVTKELQRMAVELQSKQEQIEALSAQNMELGSKVDNLVIDLRKLIDENTELNKRVIALETSLRTQADAFEKNRAELEEIKAQNSDLNGRNQELTANIERVTAELRSKEAQVVDKTKECEELRRQLEAVRAEKESLVRERDTDKELLRKCLEREAPGSGADAEEVEYALATPGGPTGLEEQMYALATGCPELDVKVIDRIKVQLLEDKIFYVIVRNKDGVSKYYRFEIITNTEELSCLSSNLNEYVKEMKNSKKLILLFDENGYLEVELIDTQMKRLKSNQEIFDYIIGLQTVKNIPIVYENTSFKLNYRFYNKTDFFRIYYDTDTKLKTIIDPDVDGDNREQRKYRRERSKKRKQGLSFRRGGSRTKKLNKINSINKSKKINF